MLVSVFEMVAKDTAGGCVFAIYRERERERESAREREIEKERERERKREEGIRIRNEVKLISLQSNYKYDKQKTNI